MTINEWQTSSNEANEDRMRLLETSLLEIHKLLTLIQTRLIGGLDTDKPGLINDLKNLQDKISVVESEIENIKRDYAKELLLQSVVRDIREIKSGAGGLSDIWKEIEKNNKFRWMMLGGIAVIDGAVILWDTLRR